MTTVRSVRFTRRVVRPGGAHRTLHALGRMLAASVALVCATLVLPHALGAQEGVVAGTVHAEGSARPLAGAQVTVQGQTGKGALVDASGRFRISGVTGTQVVLDVRMIGYRATSVAARVGATDVRVVMSERAVELDQVVVTGTAGNQQQRAIGNSVARVDASNVVQQAQISSVQELINGRAPGVVVMPGTGMVGSGSKIRIRGNSTFSLSADPLIYVDGVRVNNETGSGISIQAFGSGVISRLNDFSPEEIESIEILKGPAAATLYGTEASRGVINIITKKGASSGTRYAFSVKRGQQMLWDYEDLVPTNYWRDPATDIVHSVNVAKTEKERGTPLFRKGLVENYAANVSGGTGILRYFASGEVSNDEGAEPNNARRQFSGRTNLQITPSSMVDIQTSLGYIQSHTTLSCEAGCGGATWGAWYSTPRNLPEFCAPTAPESCKWVRGFQSSPPEADRAMQDWQDMNRFTGSATVNFRPFQWMTHRFTAGTDFSQEKNEELLPYLSNDTLRFFWGQYADGWKWANRREVILNTYDYAGSVNLDVTPKINSVSSIGVQYYKKYISSLTVYGEFFPAPGLETVGSAATRPSSGDGVLENRTFGFYGQQQFGWQDRLFATAALRVDNNSAFGNDIDWVTYPKLSLSWVMSEEPSLDRFQPSWLSTFKLRAAYGQSGQQPQIFTALRTYSPVPGPGGTGALTPQLVGNPALGPEKGKETELGFDAGFMDERFGLDFTFYRTRTENAILLRGVA
ncbi:MAG TPA: TonB-dependent receptor, partial [Gemmatimonadaceae bacterium]|nr:TonB-dependent receptor [Gemmatimonadaceae bacterium]